MKLNAYDRATFPIAVVHAIRTSATFLRDETAMHSNRVKEMSTCGVRFFLSCVCLLNCEVPIVSKIIRLLLALLSGTVVMVYISQGSAASSCLHTPLSSTLETRMTSKKPCSKATILTAHFRLVKPQS
jgi:hypothetical protein